MLGKTVITDVKTGLVLGEIVWDRRGSNRRGYSLSGFSIFINKINIKEVSPTTKAKFNYYIQSVYRFNKLRKIKKEADLEIYSNFFSTENRTDFLFEGKKEFAFKTIHDFQIGVMKDMILSERGIIPLTDAFLKREYTYRLKEFKVKQKRK
jgi:hypothetical protein